ncbi:TniQ family protein [Hyphomonas sp.]|uniref:TniQ family protein n=1 Tax=Hyphomonas sp. TaxID=87 RepID=UPI003266F0D4
MSVLFPHIPIDPIETPISFAARLAEFHLCTDLRSFLKGMGIYPKELLSGKADAIECFAHLAGVSAASLYRNTACAVSKRRFDVRGNLLSAEFFNPGIVFCPACLRDDDTDACDRARGRRGHFAWTLRPVRTCSIHGLALTYRKVAQWDAKFRELDRLVPERGAELDKLVDEAQPQSPSPLQDYVIARLAGAAGPSWLDSQTLEQAVRSTEMLGMLAGFGAEAKPSKLSHQDWDRAGRAGYFVTSAGEQGIRELLYTVQGGFRGRSAKPGRRKLFGATYEWLASSGTSKEPGDIKRIMREHIFETMEVATGGQVLGDMLPARRLHSVETLASESGLDARTMRNVLAAKGLIPVEAKISAYHVFDAQAGRAIAASVQRRTNVSDLPEALNCTRTQVDQLIDEGLLLPISDGPTDAAGRTWKAVPNKEIARFLTDLHERARVVDVIASEMVPISKAAEKAKVPCVAIVQLILAGFLENITRCNQEEGYAALHVDPLEVRTQAALRLPGISASKAFGRLKIPKSTGWALIDRDEGPSPEVLTIKGPTGRYPIYRFAEESLEAFMSEFITDVRVANAYDVQKLVAVSRMKKAGIRPVIKKAEVGVDFYRVSDIAKLEAA